MATAFVIDLRQSDGASQLTGLYAHWDGRLWAAGDTVLMRPASSAEQSARAMREAQELIAINNMFVAGASTSSTAFVLDGGTSTILNNVLVGHDVLLQSGSISDIGVFNAGGWSGAAPGDVGGNVLVASASFDADGFHLSADSPALDVGLELASYDVPAELRVSVRRDWDGDRRPQGPGWDAGADERITH